MQSLSPQKRACPHWLPGVLVGLCAAQPLLDVLSFWTQDLAWGSKLTLSLRLLIFLGVMLTGFVLSGHKRAYWITAAVCAVLYAAHVLACLRANKAFTAANLISDATNFIRVAQIPLFTIAFITFLRCCRQGFASFERGIMEIAPRDGESGWGAIGAWAWGTSRVVDYILQDDRFANDKIATIGVSRAGKTSLWCGAQDERIGAVISTVSGCGGASLLREKTGEHIRNMSKQFPHWTCDKYAEYAEKEDELPIDQHMLLALCAPRPLYLSDAIEDEWADPHKAFEAAQLASEVYEVYGKPGLRGDVFPEVHHPLTEGTIAYHVRTGGHGLILYDWQQYIPFLNRCFSL